MDQGLWTKRRTLCLLRNSFDNDEDMILRRTEDGAEKCSLRDLRREDETSTEMLESAHAIRPEDYESTIIIQQ
jgi:hypothetical protein